MQNVVLIIHLLLALCLIGVVLLQRSEGGGLGMGGGGGAITGRAAATALGKLTWILAIAFIGTSMTLTIIAARNASEGSVLDRITDAPAKEESAPAVPDAGDDLLPPSSDEGEPLLPKAD